MKKTLAHIIIASILCVAVVLAIVQPPKRFYPSLEVADLSGAVTLRFLFDGLSTVSECEALTGNITRITLASCQQCRISKLSCNSSLDAEGRTLLSQAPIAVPSARTKNGAMTFSASTPELALSVCQQAETQSAKNVVAPVKCYPAKADRIKLTEKLPISLWAVVKLVAALLSSWLVGWLIIRYEHLHAHFSHDHTGSGPQKYHAQPTPRIGGLTVMTGLLAAGAITLLVDSVATERAFGLLILAALPAFLGGLVEDVTKKIGVLERLLLTMCSGAVAAWLLGAVLNRLSVPILDQALLWLPFSVIFTTFAVGGIANAMNIIDGYNGLASGFSVIVLAAMAFVASSVGDALIFDTSLALAGAILGFLLWNWPGGKIFFGDGGAYLVGFLLAELSILLVLRNPEISPWFPLLLLIYPIFETIFSIYRRKFQNNLSPGQPDNQHLHQLIYDKLIPHQPHGKHFSRNSQVAKYLWIPTGVLTIFGSMFAGSTPILASAALGFCVFYVVNYRRIAAISVVKHASVQIRLEH